MNDTSTALVVYCTAPTSEEAHTLARTLVEERLAACCTIIERVHSVYRWQEVVEEAEEWLVIIKTTSERYAALEQRVHELHSYDTPEVLALPVLCGSDRYLDWLHAAVR